MTILVTGSSGFIGFHLCKRLLADGKNVVGVDSMNNYYDIKLKDKRLKILKNLYKKSFVFCKTKIDNKNKLIKIFSKYKPKKVINLAAQAGVRYSLINPDEYIQTNLVGFHNIIECCKKYNIEHFVYASSSSVYGGNENMPFSESQSVDHPVSLYAASKKANELIAHSYSHLFKLPATGLRFFTVYGPWGRPDMALFLFTKAILEGNTIDIYNNGEMTRDFTYIDDIVESVVRLLEKIPSSDNNFDRQKPNPASSWAPHRVFNIGNSKPTSLMDFISAIEKCLSKKAKKNFLPMQPGDVPATAANTELLESLINFKPSTSIEDGIEKFINWYRMFYKI